jgi:hypothetical protein
MATQATHNTFTESPLPIYRLDVGTYSRYVDAGALEGVEVELLDGLLVNKWPHREDCIRRLDVGTFERMVASGELEGRPATDWSTCPPRPSSYARSLARTATGAARSTGSAPRCHHRPRAWPIST